MVGRLCLDDFAPMSWPWSRSDSGAPKGTPAAFEGRNHGGFVGVRVSDGDGDAPASMVMNDAGGELVEGAPE